MRTAQTKKRDADNLTGFKECRENRMVRSIAKDVDKGFKGGVVKSDESNGCFKIRLRETQGRMQNFD